MILARERSDCVIERKSFRNWFSHRTRAYRSEVNFTVNTCFQPLLLTSTTFTFGFMFINSGKSRWTNDYATWRRVSTASEKPRDDLGIFTEKSVKLSLTLPEIIPGKVGIRYEHTISRRQQSNSRQPTSRHFSISTRVYASACVYVTWARV